MLDFKDFASTGSCNYQVLGYLAQKDCFFDLHKAGFSKKICEKQNFLI